MSWDSVALVVALVVALAPLAIVIACRDKRTMRMVAPIVLRVLSKRTITVIRVIRTGRIIPRGLRRGRRAGGKPLAPLGFRKP